MKRTRNETTLRSLEVFPESVLLFVVVLTVAGMVLALLEGTLDLTPALGVIALAACSPFCAAALYPLRRRVVLSAESLRDIRWFGERTYPRAAIVAVELVPVPGAAAPPIRCGCS